MPKFKLVSDKNLVKVVKRYWGKVPVSERERNVFEDNLLPGLFRPQLQGKHKIIYTAPMGKSLGVYMKKDVTVHRLYSILAQTVEIVKKVETYSFYLNNLVLDERLIFVRELTGELYFLYEPVESRENSTNVFAFLADLVSGVKSEEREVQQECERLKRFFAEPGNYRVEDIETFILDVYPQIYQQITRTQRENSGKSGYIASSQLSYEEHYGGNISRENTGRQWEALEDEGGTTLLQEEEGGTTLLQEDEGGTVLLSEQKPAAKLCRKRSGETYEIYGYEFLIGKGSSAECHISENKAISRKHATIFTRGGEYAIRDENSTNHTYVNGRMLEPGKEEWLQSGDVIRLADEEFDFYIQ